MGGRASSGSQGSSSCQAGVCINLVPAVPPSNKKAVTTAPAMIAVKKASAHPAAKEAEHKQKPSGLRYMGCFSDRLDDRDLPTYYGQVATPEQCGASCEALNKGYRS